MISDSCEDHLSNNGILSVIHGTVVVFWDDREVITIIIVFSTSFICFIVSYI